MSVESILIYIGIPAFGALASAIVGVWLYFGRKCDALEAATEIVRRENYEFKIYCSQQYATLIYTKDVESRMVAALNRIEGKIDRLFEARMEHSDRRER